MMDCQSTREWLLQAEYPGRLDDGPGGLARHVVSCGRCRRLAHVLTRIEADVRRQPVPAGADAARQRFLRRLPPPVPVVAVPGGWRFVRSRWALAAAVLLLAAPIVWLSMPSPQRAETPDLVDRLVDWNLEVAQAGDAREELAAGLRMEVNEADLPRDDRDLAEALLQTGSRIAAAPDPANQADRFNELADRLLPLIDSAKNKKDAQRLRKLAEYYGRVERRIQSNLERANNVGKPSAQSKRILDQVKKAEAQRQVRLEQMIEQLPPNTQKEVRRALKPKAKKSGSRRQKKS
jgi:hypothetical protein